MGYEVKALKVVNGRVAVITMAGKTIFPLSRCHTIHEADTGTEDNPDGNSSVLPKYDPQTQRFLVETDDALRHLREMMAFCAKDLGIVDKLPAAIRGAVMAIITPKEKRRAPRFPKSKPVSSWPPRVVNTAHQEAATV